MVDNVSERFNLIQNANRRHRLICAISISVLWISFCIIVINQVTGHCPLGLADNGDYGRMMYKFGLSSSAVNDYERYFNFLNLKYIYDPSIGYDTGYKSSQEVFIWTSLQIYKLINLPYFDVRFLGLTQVIVYCFITGLVGYGLYKTNKWWGVALFFLFTFMFSDAGYIQYFNSFYIEGGILIWSVGLVGSGTLVLVNYKSTIINKAIGLLLFFIFSILIITAKQQYTPLFIIFAIMGVYLTITVFQTKTLIKIGLGIFICIVLSLVSIWYFKNGAPISVRKANTFNSVFNGILMVSPNPVHDLMILGVSDPAALIPLIGKNYWETEHIQQHLNMDDIFYSRIGLREILIYYLTHPERLITLLNDISSNSLELSLPYLGNFPNVDNINPKERSEQFIYWSKFKANYHWQSFLVVSIPLLLSLIIGVIVSVSSNSAINRMALFMIGYPIMAWMQLLITAIGDGFYEHVKHLYSFNIVFDLILLTILGWILAVGERILSDNWGVPPTKEIQQ